MSYNTSKSVLEPVVSQVERIYTKKDFRTFTMFPNTYNPDGSIKESGRVMVEVVFGNNLDAAGNLIVEHMEQAIWAEAQYEAFCVRNAALMGAVRDALAAETA